MSKPASVRLTADAEAALAWLKEQVGGFNLQQAVNKTIVAEAQRRGWRGGESSSTMLSGGGWPVTKK